MLILWSTAAVVYWASRPTRVHVNFVTDPFEATIDLDGELQTDADGNPYTTPCTIENLPAGVHRVVFKRPGLEDLDLGPRDFANERRIEGRWDSTAQRD